MAFGSNVINIIIRAKDEFSKTFNNVKLSMKNFRTATVPLIAVSAAIAAGFGMAVKTGIELESAMVGVRKTTGMTADEIKVLRDEFIDLSQIMPVSATDLASIGEVAGQLGIQGKEDIKSFTETVAKMSIATELNAEDSALALAKISNAMGLPIEEAEKLGSAINELSNISAASSSEIVSAVTRVAGSAKTLGLSTEDVTGMTAALIASGEPAERAGTKLRSAFDQVVKNIDKASAVVPGFADKLREDAGGAIMELIKGISDIEDPIKKQTTAMDIFGTVGASAINKLSNNLPELETLMAASSEQFENATSLQDEYEIASQSTANQIQLLKNQFGALGLEIADILIPIIRDFLIPIISKVLEWFKALPGPVKLFLVILGLVTIAVTALAVAIGVLMLVSSPVLLIILAAIAIITAIIFLIIKWKDVTLFLAKLVIRAAIEMGMKWAWLKDMFLLAWTGIKNAFFTIWNSILDYYQGVINKIINGINIVIKGMNKIKGVDIPLIPNIDFGALKGEMTNIGALSATLEGERGAYRGKLESEADVLMEGLANKLGKTEVNIENVYGTDPDEIMGAVQENISDKIKY